MIDAATFEKAQAELVGKVTEAGERMKKAGVDNVMGPWLDAEQAKGTVEIVVQLAMVQLACSVISAVAATMPPEIRAQLPDTMAETVKINLSEMLQAYTQTGAMN